MLLSILFIITYILGNRIRGAGKGEYIEYIGFKKPKWLLKIVVYAIISSAVFGIMLLTGFDIKTAALFSLLNFVTDYICFAFGWGKFFPHTMDVSKEREFLPAEFMANLFHGKYTSDTPDDRAVKWKTTAMGFRFMLTFGIAKPLIGFLVFKNILVFLLLPAYFIIGLAYMVAFSKHTSQSLPLAELYAGGILGGLLAVIVLSQKMVVNFNIL